MSIQKLRSHLVESTAPLWSMFATRGEVEAALAEHDALMRQLSASMQNVQLSIEVTNEAMERALKAEAEIERLRQELTVISKARRMTWTGDTELADWVIVRALYALGQKPGELTVKKADQKGENKC